MFWLDCHSRRRCWFFFCIVFLRVRVIYNITSQPSYNEDDDDDDDDVDDVDDDDGCDDGDDAVKRTDRDKGAQRLSKTSD